MKPVRRVIIAQNEMDKSVILEDNYAHDIDHFITGVAEAVSINLWATITTPAKLTEVDDPTLSGLPFLPSKNGTVFRICDIPPDSFYIYRLDEILLNNEKISTAQKMLKHPLMHKVDVLSYAIVLEGEVVLITDNSQATLRPGDTVIDCGSHHAWSNQTDSICRIAFVLIDAKRE